MAEDTNYVLLLLSGSILSTIPQNAITHSELTLLSVHLIGWPEPCVTPGGSERILSRTDRNLSEADRREKPQPFSVLMLLYWQSTELGLMAHSGFSVTVTSGSFSSVCWSTEPRIMKDPDTKRVSTRTPHSNRLGCVGFQQGSRVNSVCLLTAWSLLFLCPHSIPPDVVSTQRWYLSQLITAQCVKPCYKRPT